MTYDNGDKYEGSWVDGEYNGEGEFSCAEYVFKGVYSDKKNADGIKYDLATGTAVSGKFVDGEFIANELN